MDVLRNCMSVGETSPCCRRGFLLACRLCVIAICLSLLFFCALCSALLNGAIVKPHCNALAAPGAGLEEHPQDLSIATPDFSVSVTRCNHSNVLCTYGRLTWSKPKLQLNFKHSVKHTHEKTCPDFSAYIESHALILKVILKDFS